MHTWPCMVLVYIVTTNQTSSFEVGNMTASSCGLVQLKKPNHGRIEGLKMEEIINNQLIFNRWNVEETSCLSLF